VTGAIRRWLRSVLDRNPLHPLVVALRFVRALGLRALPAVACNLHRSRAQLLQDLFVLIALDGKRNGYFVEIGAGDGEFLSNTWLLEKHYGWTGILAEPNRVSGARIRASRGAALEPRAVWHTTGERLPFVDVAGTRELSTLQAFQHGDAYARSGETYEVETVSLNDLLAAHGAPAEIDYLSLDTEGSEWEILSRLDFARYRVAIFTIEHNHDAARLARIEALLARHGYRRAHAGITRFDAWFVRDGGQASG